MRSISLRENPGNATGSSILSMARKEFIGRNGEFTVNIALIEDKTAVAGVVYVPVSGVSYFGGIGLGAWKQDLNRPDAVASPIKCRLMEQENGVSIVASRRHRGEDLDAVIQQIEEQLGKATL